MKTIGRKIDIVGTCNTQSTADFFVVMLNFMILTDNNVIKQKFFIIFSNQTQNREGIYSRDSKKLV